MVLLPAAGPAPPSPAPAGLSVAGLAEAEQQRRRRRRAKQPPPPSTDIALLGYLSACSPVLQVHTAAAAKRRVFCAQLCDRPPNQGRSSTSSEASVTVLFDGTEAAGWRAFLPSPVAACRLRITGLSRTRFELGAAVSQHVLVVRPNAAPLESSPFLD